MKAKAIAIPYIVWMAIFIVVPLVLVVVYAFTAADGSFTVANFNHMGDYTAVFARSFLLAVIATAICLILGYPFSFVLQAVSAASM